MALTSSAITYHESYSFHLVTCTVPVPAVFDVILSHSSTHRDIYSGCGLGGTGKSGQTSLYVATDIPAPMARYGTNLQSTVYIP